MMDRNDEERVNDRVDPARAEALLATLGSVQAIESGSELPVFAHHAYFWTPSAEADLGRDGHRATGGLVPDLGLPLRMWAGGRIRWHAPFRAGINAERFSRVTAVTRKEGRTGKLAFVTLRHEIRQRSQPVLTEDQDIVYREAGELVNDAPAAAESPDERRALKLSNITLFRYSALTFNAHRIHYDQSYCEREGYPGLVVHGPLMAMSLALMAAERKPLEKFEFRATAPVYLGDVVWLCRAGERYWVEGPRRRLCMTATAE
ncbi:MAG: acyl dehydratase [Silicimonas sp.]|nr:acyl dehydratase [Silicimonas sp.]